MIYALWTHIFSSCPESKPIGIISISSSTSIGIVDWQLVTSKRRTTTVGPLMVDLKSGKSQFAFGIIQFFISLKYFWVWRNACISSSLQYSIFCQFVSLALPCTHTLTHTLVWTYMNCQRHGLKMCCLLLCAHYSPFAVKRLLICVFCVLWAGFLCVYLFIGICGKYEKNLFLPYFHMLVSQPFTGNMFLAGCVV